MPLDCPQSSLPRLTFDDDQDTLPCLVEDFRLWFSDQPDELERAKQHCGRCPIRQSCLAGALERRETAGVWGGEILVGGIVIARKRPRGRPRKPGSASA